jgi:DNA-binding beta-propeller fold protein YncE
MRKIFGILPLGMIQITKSLIFCIVFLHLLTIQPSAAEIRVITIAGSGEYSTTDGPALAAELADPVGIAVDPAGSILFTQAETTIVRKVTLDKKVITIAGKIRRGHKDGPVKEAVFKEARAIAVAKNGTIYVGDHTTVGIRRISPEGMVSTIAGPMHGRFIDIKPHEKSYWIGIQFSFDPKGNIIFGATMYPTYVLSLTPDGTVSKVAGNSRSGYVDGPAETAEFRMPCGIAVAPDGSIYVADGHASGGAIYQPGNNVIRKISKGTVSTFAGTGKPGFKDGPGKEAEFNSPMALAVDPRGNIYVSDSENHCIRVIKPDGMVETIAGTPGKPGFADGPGKAAQFNGPRGIAFDAEGNLIVADLGNNRIRKIIFP